MMEGQIEKSLLELTKQHTPNLEVVITRPGGIEGPGHPKDDALRNLGTVWTYAVGACVGSGGYDD